MAINQPSGRRGNRGGMRGSRPHSSWPMRRIDEDQDGGNLDGHAPQANNLKGIKAVHAVQGYMSHAGSSLSSVREMLPDVTSAVPAPHAQRPGSVDISPRQPPSPRFTHRQSRGQGQRRQGMRMPAGPGLHAPGMGAICHACMCLSDVHGAAHACQCLMFLLSCFGHVSSLFMKSVMEKCAGFVCS